MRTWKKGAISHLRLMMIKITTRARPPISTLTWLILFKTRAGRARAVTAVLSVTECSNSGRRISVTRKPSPATSTSSLARLETQVALPESAPELTAMAQTTVITKMWAPLTARCPLERMKKVKLRSKKESLLRKKIKKTRKRVVRVRLMLIKTSSIYERKSHSKRSVLTCSISKIGMAWLL